MFSNVNVPRNSIQFPSTNNPTNNSTVGYDFELEDESNTLQSYKCIICFCLMKDVVELQCGHAGCKVCIETWTRTSRNCPTCRYSFNLFGNKLNPVRSLDRIIRNDIRVKCMQKQQCSWVGSIDQYYESHEKKCDYIEVNCSHVGCLTGKKLRKDIKDHEKECEHREVLCTFCNLTKVKFKDLSVHELNCVIWCPNGCQSPLNKNSYEDHMAVCEYASVKCAFHVYGCETEMRRNEKKKHWDESVEIHFLLAVTRLDSNGKEIDKINTDLQNIKSDSENTKLELQNIKTDFERTKVELRNTKVELETVKEELETVKVELEIGKVRSKSTRKESENTKSEPRKSNSDLKRKSSSSTGTRTVRLPSEVSVPLTVTTYPSSSSSFSSKASDLTVTKKRARIEDDSEKTVEAQYQRFEYLANLMENNRRDFFRDWKQKDACLLSRKGETLLHRAVSMKDHPAQFSVRRLIKDGCPLDVKNEKGNTCLGEAVLRDIYHKDAFRMIDELLKYGKFSKDDIKDILNLIYNSRRQCDQKLLHKIESYNQELQRNSDTIPPSEDVIQLI